MDKLKTKRVVMGAGFAAPQYAVLVEPATILPRALERRGSAADGQAGLAGLERRHHQGHASRRAAAGLRRGAARSTRSCSPRRSSPAASTRWECCSGAALPSIRIEPATEFYDYQAKYLRNDTQYHCPSGLDDGAEAALRSAALAAFRVTDCHGWGRVDFMLEAASGKFYFIEINTTPGMTDHSLVPMAAARAGIDFEELCWRVLETSFVRERK